MVLMPIDYSAFVIESREKKYEELYKGGVNWMAQKVGKGHSYSACFLLDIPQANTCSVCALLT